MPLLRLADADRPVSIYWISLEHLGQRESRSATAPWLSFHDILLEIENVFKITNTLICVFF